MIIVLVITSKISPAKIGNKGAEYLNKITKTLVKSLYLYMIYKYQHPSVTSTSLSVVSHILSSIRRSKVCNQELLDFVEYIQYLLSIKHGRQAILSSTENGGKSVFKRTYLLTLWPQ